MAADYVVMISYLVAMVAIGSYAANRAKTKSEFLVAGRRLGYVMYSGTMAAVVIGGGSTIGGVRLGYKFGISGAWLVLTIGCGVLGLSLLFAKRINRLRVYTVSEMLSLRYGVSSAAISGIVMWAYALMIMVTSTVACATIFGVLFDMNKTASVALGGGIVVLYSVLGGMWSITLTDMVQFAVKTIGVMFLLLPIAISKAGGFGGIESKVDDSYFSLLTIGTETIFTYILIYFLGLFIGQDIWQRVFTARDDKVATIGGSISGVYCVAYAFTGALIGTATKALYPNLEVPDQAFATIVDGVLPTGIRGLVLAAALAAIMSTASGALIACATVASNDLWPRLRRLFGRDGEYDEVRTSRLFMLVLGILGIVVAAALQDVLEALSIAYNLLVGGLFVPILGALVWRRSTSQGAIAGILVGCGVVTVLMFTHGPLENEPIMYGLPASLIAYVVVSLLTPRTDAAVLEAWQRRLAGHAPSEEPAVPTPTSTGK
jgi:solute:Na+ symporter, SSS family